MPWSQFNNLRMKREPILTRNSRLIVYLGLLSLGIAGAPHSLLAQDNAPLADFQKRIEELTAQEQSLREQEQAILSGQSTAGESPKVPAQQLPPSAGRIQPPEHGTENQDTSKPPPTPLTDQGVDLPSAAQPPLPVPGRPSEGLPPATSSVESGSEIARLRKENERLKNALNETKLRLVVAETQIERLSALLEGRQPPPPQTTRDSRKDPKSPSSLQESSPLLARTPVKPRLDSRNSVPILSVATLNVNLRSGPGLSFPAVQTAPRGTKFVYESQQGNWYKVITASGERLWVNASAVTLGQLTSSRKNLGENAVPTQQDSLDNQAGADDRAFDALRQR